MTLAFRPQPGTEHARDDCRSYAVAWDGRTIGTVESKRTDSWRTTPTGVRYSKRGSPKHWEARGRDGARVGYRFSTRTDAAAALIDALHGEERDQ